MRRRRWRWAVVCALTAAALGCSDDLPAQQAQREQAAAQAAQVVEQQQGEEQAQPARPTAAEPPAQQAEPEPPPADADADTAEPQADRPAMQPQQQQAGLQQDAYGDAAAPPQSAAPPREALADGFALLPSAAGEGDEYGWSAAIDEDTIAVGAPYHDAVAQDAGAVFIFERRADQWVETAKLLPPFGESAGWFGRWLALDAGRLLIGAPYEDVRPAEGGAPLTDVGTAYIYEHVGGEWRRTATLLPEPLQAGASFGWSVAIDGDRLAVSAWSETVGEAAAGAVYVYREAKGVWRLEARVTPPDPQPAHQFGRDIELEQNVLVVGAPGDDGEYSDSGAVYVYHQFNFAWNYAGKFVAPEGSGGDALGTQVALSLPWFAAGAHNQDADGWDAGALYLWRLGSQWEFHTRLSPSDAAEGDWFGYAPAMQGERLVVGAPHRADPDTGLYRTGAAYIFDLADGGWVERGVVGPVDPLTAGEKAEFGWVTDVHADLIVVGSWLADAEAGEDAGAAAAYELE